MSSQYWANMAAQWRVQKEEVPNNIVENNSIPMDVDMNDQNDSMDMEMDIVPEQQTQQIIPPPPPRPANNQAQNEAQQSTLPPLPVNTQPFQPPLPNQTQPAQPGAQLPVQPQQQQPVQPTQQQYQQNPGLMGMMPQQGYMNQAPQFYQQQYQPSFQQPGFAQQPMGMYQQPYGQNDWMMPSNANMTAPAPMGQQALQPQGMSTPQRQRRLSIDHKDERRRDHDRSDRYDRESDRDRHDRDRDHDRHKDHDHYDDRHDRHDRRERRGSFDHRQSSAKKEHFDKLLKESNGGGYQAELEAKKKQIPEWLREHLKKREKELERLNSEDATGDNMEVKKIDEDDTDFMKNINKLDEEPKTTELSRGHSMFSDSEDSSSDSESDDSDFGSSKKKSKKKKKKSTVIAPSNTIAPPSKKKPSFTFADLPIKEQAEEIRRVLTESLVGATNRMMEEIATEELASAIALDVFSSDFGGSAEVKSSSLVKKDGGLSGGPMKPSSLRSKSKTQRKGKSSFGFTKQEATVVAPPAMVSTPPKSILRAFGGDSDSDSDSDEDSDDLKKRGSASDDLSATILDEREQELKERLANKKRTSFAPDIGFADLEEENMNNELNASIVSTSTMREIPLEWPGGNPPSNNQLGRYMFPTWSLPLSQSPSKEVSIEVFENGSIIQRFGLKTHCVMFGRDIANCGIVNDHSSVSRQHCVIQLDTNSTPVIHDLSSANGTFIFPPGVDDTTMAQRVDPNMPLPLKSGSRISLGSCPLRYRIKATNIAQPEVSVLSSLTSIDGSAKKKRTSRFSSSSSTPVIVPPPALESVVSTSIATTDAAVHPEPSTKHSHSKRRHRSRSRSRSHSPSGSSSRSRSRSRSRERHHHHSSKSKKSSSSSSKRHSSHSSSRRSSKKSSSRHNRRSRSRSRERKRRH